MTTDPLEIHDPWTMPPLEYVDMFIEALQKQIDSQHLLYGRKVFPVALRHRPDAVIYETDDEPFVYALVFLSWYGDALSAKPRRNPKTQILVNYQAIQELINKDHAEWLAQFSDSKRD